MASTTTPLASETPAGLMRANTSWAFAGNAVYAGCQWMVFVVLVKQLPLEDVGQFAFWVALTGPIFLLANLRLRNLLATRVPSPGDFADYLRTRLLTTSAAFGLSLCIGALTVANHGWLLAGGLIACARACDAISDICHGLFQRELDMRRAATGLMVNGLGSLVLVGAMLAVWPTLASAAVGYAAGSCLALLTWDLPRARSLAGPRAALVGGRLFATAGCLIRRAWPLGLSSAIGSAQVNLPRYVVAAYLGPAGLAIFSALAYITALGNLTVNAMAQAALPLLARDFKSSRPAYRARLVRLVTLGTGLGLAGVLCTAIAGRALLSWVYSSEYADHVAVLLCLMTASAVSYAFVFLGTASTARMRFSAQCLISCAGLLVVACAAPPLVARHGLMGAAWSLIAGALVEGSAYCALTIRDLRILNTAHDIPHALVEGART